MGTCGARISFVRDSDVATLESVNIFTGPFDEEGACRFVSDEFPDVCTCSCDEDEDEPPEDPIEESPTGAPTVSPTTSPTASPTESPTASDECQDSPLDARINRRDRDCAWIVENDKCSRNKFKFHCRASCDKCDQCKDSKLFFKANIDGTEETIKCAQDVNTGEETIARLCADGDIALTCPKTCGAC